MEVTAWLILRICFAGLFLFALKDLLKNIDASINLVKLIIPYKAHFFTIVMFIVMLLGALSILFGIYAQIAGFFLLFYCLCGVVVHYRLANRIATIQLSTAPSQEDKKHLEEVVALGVVGNQTSGQKNIVLAAVACFFMLLGSGPLSLTGNLF